MLTGTVADIRPLHVVLLSNGVGYLVAVKDSARFSHGDQAELHTHLAVRENAMDLYGFDTKDELEMFEQLLRLPKIGPKSAMQILVQADLELLKKSIISGDATYLSKMSGIGKKSAEKIVTGLRDIFEQETAGTPHALNSSDGDVVDALMALGYSQRDSLNALQKLSPDIADTKDRIKEALKQVSK